MSLIKNGEVDKNISWDLSALVNERLEKCPPKSCRLTNLSLPQNLKCQAGQKFSSQRGNELRNGFLIDSRCTLLLTFTLKWAEAFSKWSFWNKAPPWPQMGPKYVRPRSNFSFQIEGSQQRMGLWALSTQSKFMWKVTACKTVYEQSLSVDNKNMWPSRPSIGWAALKWTRSE